MKLSIITPCSRPLNLPAIYASILEMNESDVEWIIIYDSDEIDKRILAYEKEVPIILLKERRGVGKGSMQRNAGLNICSGDYIYFLDDDNLVHPMLYNRICVYGKENKILIFNQFSHENKKRINFFHVSNLSPGYIDTAQIVVPKKYKHIKWSNKRRVIEEHDYLVDLIKEAGEDNVKWVNRLFSYRNYLRRYSLENN